MSPKAEIMEYFKNLPEVKRIKELEHYIDTNKEIKEKFEEIKVIQKELVNAKESRQFVRMKEYEQKWNRGIEELKELPFVEEYLELVEIINQKWNQFIFLIENGIQCLLK